MLKPLLVDRMRTLGPLSIEEYMAQCLYHPDYGYYGNCFSIGHQGDFVTAPEISSLFGMTIRGALEVLAKDYPYKKARLVDLGGGRGTLMKDMIEGEGKGVPDRDHYIVETSSFLRSIQKETLKNFAVQWVEDLPTLFSYSEGQPLLVVANEFFDAFPIRQHIFKDSTWKERIVDVTPQGTFYFSTREADFIPNAAYPLPTEGVYLEDSPRACEYFKELLRYLKAYGGILILVDYGYTNFLSGDTFQAIENHQYADPLENPGLQDLTAHINFKAFIHIAHSMGLRTLPLMTQQEFLRHYGLEYYLLKGWDSLDGLAKKVAMEALRKLTDPTGMGSLFKVLIIVE